MTATTTTATLATSFNFRGIRVESEVPISEVTARILSGRHEGVVEAWHHFNNSEVRVVGGGRLKVTSRTTSVTSEIEGHIFCLSNSVMDPGMASATLTFGDEVWNLNSSGKSWYTTGTYNVVRVVEEGDVEDVELEADGRKVTLSLLEDGTIVSVKGEGVTRWEYSDRCEYGPTPSSGHFEAVSPWEVVTFDDDEENARNAALEEMRCCEFEGICVWFGGTRFVWVDHNDEWVLVADED